MGWSAAAQSRGLLLSPGTLLSVRRADDRRPLRHGSRDRVSARAAPGRPLAPAAAGAVGGAGGDDAAHLAVVRRASRFILLAGRAVARAVVGAGTIPAIDELHLVARPGTGPARLGGARGDRRLQHPRGAARPEGGEGRAAGADPALPFQAGARWRARHRRAVRRPGVRRDAGTAGPARDPRAAPAGCRRGGV